jgi:hypothetical protein
MQVGLVIVAGQMRLFFQKGFVKKIVSPVVSRMDNLDGAIRN